ncbi:unnamed protein product [Protopolystoma xenopodis]|uniref:Uncharacterized protein n=1 Tax=Protopolystoma xenopodis TaxID=117903 RepID=A0A3S5B0M6_9PLAT|nr:unnamed protein product [Protopolystoma xenopodis]
MLPRANILRVPTTSLASKVDKTASSTARSVGSSKTNSAHNDFGTDPRMPMQSLGGLRREERQLVTSNHFHSNQLLLPESTITSE